MKKMINISTQDGNWVIAIPKERIGAAFVQRFFERLEVDSIIQKSQMTETQAWELSEAIKKEWWDNNRERILAKIREA